MLLRKLLSEPIGTLVEASRAGGLEIALLPLVLGLLVGVLEVASIAIAAHLLLLLCAPDLLLTSLIRVHRLRKCRRCGGKRTALLLCILVVAVTPTTKAKVQLQAVALLLVVHREVNAELGWPARACSVCCGSKKVVGGVLGGESPQCFRRRGGVGECPVAAGRERADGGIKLQTVFQTAQSSGRTPERRITANSWREGDADGGLFRQELKSGSRFLARWAM